MMVASDSECFPRGSSRTRWYVGKGTMGWQVYDRAIEKSSGTKSSANFYDTRADAREVCARLNRREK